MTHAILSFDTVNTIQFVKELLTFNNNWTHRTRDQIVEIRLTGNPADVRKAVLNWLEMREQEGAKQ